MEQWRWVKLKNISIKWCSVTYLSYVKRSLIINWRSLPRNSPQIFLNFQSAILKEMWIQHQVIRHVHLHSGIWGEGRCLACQKWRFIYDLIDWIGRLFKSFYSPHWVEVKWRYQLYQFHFANDFNFYKALNVFGKVFDLQSSVLSIHHNCPINLIVIIRIKWMSHLNTSILFQ